MSRPLTPIPKVARKEAKFNFSVVKQMRDVIAVICLDAIKQKSLTVSKQQTTVYGLFHGDKLEGTMGKAEKFMNRVGMYGKMKTTKFGGTELWVNEITREGSRLVIPEELHRQIGKVLVNGDNITLNLICRTYESKELPLYTGESILIHARAARAECRKMMSLMRDAVKERVITLEDGEYGFPSGKTKSDFDDWFLPMIA
jgi:hypothetical protein